MIVSIILMALGFVLMCVFIYGKLTNYSFRVTMIKIAASALFVALAIYLYIIKNLPSVGLFIIIGGFFGLLGDLFLGFKRVFPNYAKLHTLLGMITFAIGHVVYIVGFYLYFYLPGHIASIIAPLAFGLTFGTCICVFEKKLGLNFGSMKPFGFIYYTLVSSLCATSFALMVSYSFTSVPLIIIAVGGLLFLTSDTLLGFTYFGPAKGNKMVSTIYSVAYYVAQFLIAFAIFFI